MLITCGTLYSQNTFSSCEYSIRGVILDADTKEPLPFVKVEVSGEKKTSLTDIDGAFVINNLCEENNTLIISCYGYCDTVCKDFHQHGKSPHIYIKHDVESLKEVTITAQKVVEEGTASIAQQTIKRKDILDNPTQTLASAISDVEGVTVASTGSNVQIPVIHGLYGNRVLVINNGLKHGFQNWGTDHAPEIDINSAYSIQVLKGAAGVRYGPEALGGAIVVNGNPLYLNEPLKVDIGTGYQTNGKGHFLTANVNQGIKNWSYHFGTNYTRVGDRHAPDYNLTNTGKEEKAFNAGFRYHFKNLDAKIYYSYLDQNLGLLAASFVESSDALNSAFQSDRPSIIKPFSYDIKEPNQLVKHHLAKAEVNWWYSDEAKLTLRIGRQFNQRKEFDVRRNADRPVIDLDLITNDYQLEWKHPDWFQLDGLVGLQMFTQDNDNNPGTGVTPLIPNYNTLRYSGFIIESLKMGANTYEFGTRMDYENNNIRGRDNRQNIFRDQYSFTNVTLSLGYIRDISESTHLRTNLGTAWRTPNMSELFAFGGHGFGLEYGLLRYYFNQQGVLRTDRVSILENSSIEPEKSYKWINEWSHQTNKNNYVLTAYGNYIENYVFSRPSGAVRRFSGVAPAFRVDQANSLLLGADFTWKKKWSKSIRGALGINYLWSRNIEDNDVLINQPPVSTNYKLTWKHKKLWKFTKSSFFVNPSYTFRQFNAPPLVTLQDITNSNVIVNSETKIFDFKEEPSGYFLLDIGWKFKVKQLDVGLSVKNVLDTRYRNYLNETRYFADSQGRNILLTINYILKTKTK